MVDAVENDAALLGVDRCAPGGGSTTWMRRGITPGTRRSQRFLTSGLSMTGRGIGGDPVIQPLRPERVDPSR